MQIPINQPPNPMPAGLAPKSDANTQIGAPHSARAGAHSYDFQAIVKALEGPQDAIDLPPLSADQFPPAIAPAAPGPVTPNNRFAVAAYRNLSPAPAPTAAKSQVAQYKDEQLLSNPGGDRYHLHQKRVAPDTDDQKGFFSRISKNFRDATANVKNFFGDLLFGSKFHYRDKSGQIQEGRKRGLLGSAVEFFKDMGSALSFGSWRPDGENAPQGIGQRLGFAFKKVKEAVADDLVGGVAGSVVHMGEDLLFAGWNLAETLPDATIGNFEVGRKATSAVFDNGQVVLDYVTDILPAGDAWQRTHVLDPVERKLPFYSNFKSAGHDPQDERWRYVKNTPFRKTIETIGTII